jgi:chromosome segregation ATPase
VQLEEAEVMGRLQALMERVGEMERWFTGVKAEAERERKMREQAVQRLGFMQQRVDHATKEIADLRKENLDLRVRLEELQVSQEEIKDMAARGYARPSLVGTTSLEQIRASQVCMLPDCPNECILADYPNEANPSVPGEPS